jgi:hypothetical protein
MAGRFAFIIGNLPAQQAPSTPLPALREEAGARSVPGEGRNGNRPNNASPIGAVTDAP